MNYYEYRKKVRLLVENLYVEKVPMEKIISIAERELGASPSMVEKMIKTIEEGSKDE